MQKQTFPLFFLHSHQSLGDSSPFPFLIPVARSVSAWSALGKLWAWSRRTRGSLSCLDSGDILACNLRLFLQPESSCPPMGCSNLSPKHSNKARYWNPATATASHGNENIGNPRVKQFVLCSNPACTTLTEVKMRDRQRNSGLYQFRITWEGNFLGISTAGVEGNYSLQNLGRESKLQKHQEKTLMNFITK